MIKWWILFTGSCCTPLHFISHSQQEVKSEWEKDWDRLHASRIDHESLYCQPHTIRKKLWSWFEKYQRFFLKRGFIFLVFFSFWREDDGKEVSSEGGSCTPFLFISKQSTKANSIPGVRMEATLTILSLPLEMLFPFHCLQKETAETCFVKLKVGCVNVSYN